jgi:CheY-like chemotaxis protein
MAADLAAYLVTSGGRVERAADLQAARRFAERASNGPWVWVLDAAEGPIPLADAQAAASPRGTEATTFFILGRGRRRRPRHRQPGLVEVDGNVLSMRTFLIGAAMAGGRLPDAVTPQGEEVSSPGFAPTREALRHAHTILVAEDNKVNQLVIQQQLKTLGYRADVVSNGREALERWEQGAYALLVTDLQMPEMDGYELSAAVRAIERKKGRAPVPIVALTANALKDEAQRCQDAGMNDYLTKPAGLAEVQTVLEKWLPAERSRETEPAL